MTLPPYVYPLTALAVFALLAVLYVVRTSSVYHGTVLVFMGTPYRVAYRLGKMGVPTSLTIYQDDYPVISAVASFSLAVPGGEYVYMDYLEDDSITHTLPMAEDELPMSLAYRLLTTVSLTRQTSQR